MKPGFASGLAAVLAVSAGIFFTRPLCAQLPNAWQIDDNSTAGGSTLSYFTNLSAAQFNAATNNGWRFTVTSRMVTNYLSAGPAMFVICGHGTSRYGIGLNLNSSGQFVVTPLGSSPINVTSDASAATNYHTHQLEFDPATQNVTYRFDGALITTWVGQASGGQSQQAVWGGQSSADRGAMNFHRVQFEITSLGVIASYNAGFEGNPAVAPSPTNQFWTQSTSTPTIPAGPVSPDVLGLPPVATTEAAGDFRPHFTTLNGSVNPGGVTTDYYFEYGTTTNYGGFTTTNTLAPGVVSLPILATLNGLAPLTTYHFRAVAVNGAGVSAGQDLMFTTTVLLPNAWQISDNSTVGSSTLTYLTNVTQTQKIAATNSGWRYTITSRLTADFGGIECMNFIFGFGARRYGVVWDLDAGGQLIGNLLGQGNVTLVTDPLEATNYHVHQLSYDPATQNVTYRLDGQIVGTWAGQASTGQSNIVQWGSGSSAGKGEMNFHQVRFEIEGLGVIASYHAGFELDPAVAPNPASQGWMASTMNLLVSEGPVSPDLLAPPPLAMTVPATDVGLSSAMLNAQLNSGGAGIQYYFEYGLGTNYGNFTATNTVSTGAFSIIVSNGIGGLTPATTYHFRVVASNNLGVVTGADLSFSTLSYVTTLPASGETSTTATLNALLNLGGLDAGCYFEYGLTTNYGNATTTQLISAGPASAGVSNTVSGLLPLTTYHFRAVSSNSAGIAFGEDLIFSTAAFAATLPATDVEPHGAALNALLFPGSFDVTWYFEYGTTTNYGSFTATNAISSGVASSNVVQVIAGLASITDYHFRVVASNAVGVATGEDMSFTTASIYTIGPGLYRTAAAWSDFDRDGRLDFVVTGTTTDQIPFNPISRIWRNTGSGFTPFAAVLTNNFNGSVAWGDRDNDGDMDLVMSGFFLVFPGIFTELSDNIGGSLAKVAGSFTPVTDSSLAWGDYDNDGRSDLLLAGNAPFRLAAEVWRNTSAGFSNINAGIQGIFYGTGTWGDYDNDGRLDILLVGWDTTNIHGQIWRNTGNGFSNINAAIPGVYEGAAAWGDYDNDGRLDFAITGTSDGQPTGMRTEVWRNTGSGFTNINAGMPKLVYSTLAWGDYDNDGRLDLLIAGSTTISGGNPVTQLWLNRTNGFTNLNLSLPPIIKGAVAFGDVNNDGRLDLLLTGNGVTQVRLNTMPVTNTPPGAPGSLGSIVGPQNVLLYWNPATDAQTPSPGLSYNLRVGTTPGAGDVVSAQAETDGFRLLPAPGNAQLGTNAFLNLPAGTYYWSVQAVDNAFAGGPFALDASFVVPTPAPALSIASTGTNAIISWQPALPGWILQESLSLAPVAWSNSPSGPTNPVAVPVTLPTRFYRLFKP